MSLLAMDLGGTKLASALFSPAGDLLLRESLPLAGQSGRKVGAGAAPRRSRNAIFVAVGTGIGAGLLVDGHVLHGHSDIAGAIGWLAVRQPYRAERDE